MITRDTSGRSVVVVCACGARDVFASAAAADSWARRHVDVAHPSPSAARARVVAALDERARRRKSSGPAAP